MDPVFVIASLWWAGVAFAYMRTNTGKHERERGQPIAEYHTRRFIAQQAVIAVIVGLVVESVLHKLTS